MTEDLKLDYVLQTSSVMNIAKAMADLRGARPRGFVLEALISRRAIIWRSTSEIVSGHFFLVLTLAEGDTHALSLLRAAAETRTLEGARLRRQYFGIRRDELARVVGTYAVEG